jgi:hypothetical protein
MRAAPPLRSLEGGRRRARDVRRLAKVDPRTRRAHAALRVGVLRYMLSGDLLTLATSPVVYSLLLPMAILDMWVTAFQAVCFRAWGIPRVRRGRYLVFDRRKLAYLNALEKVNCVFCGYATGVLAYVREVASRTEQYWCPIRHGRRVRDPHARYADFAAYGDADAYRRLLPALRRGLASSPGVSGHARRPGS